MEVRFSPYTQLYTVRQNVGCRSEKLNAVQVVVVRLSARILSHLLTIVQVCGVFRNTFLIKAQVFAPFLGNDVGTCFDVFAEVGE